MTEYFKDHLHVKQFDNRLQMGQAAADDIATCILKLLRKKITINMVFAAAPSQNDMLAALCKKQLPWHRIHAFHMDEYLGLDKSHPQSFGHYLDEHIFSLVPFASVHYISDYGEEYGNLPAMNEIDIVCLGIGENGHIAFNDPAVADFSDSKRIKAVELDETCRMQQVHDGCFAALNEVPTHALTLTVPQMFSGAHQFCVVPAATKRLAIYRMLNGPIDERCPATILRRHSNSTLYCDADSSALIRLPFGFSVISDEISQDIREAAEFANRYGVTALELRSVNSHSPFAYTDEDIAQIQSVTVKNNLKISAIASPLFKCKLTDENIANQTEKFEKLCVTARKLGTSIIRGFDFVDTGKSIAERAACYNVINKISEKYGITIALEPDPSLHSTTATELVKLLKAIDLPHIRALYDPANEVYKHGSMDIGGYAAIHPYMVHMHIKDAEIVDGTPRCVKVGDGKVDYAALFRRLIDDNYRGFVSLETHYRIKNVLNEEQLHLPGGADFSDGGAASSAESILALHKILAQEMTKQ